MMKNTYNGWTNKQTWNLSIRYEGIFASLVKDSTFEDVDCLADAFECLVDELEFEEVEEYSLAYEALNDYLSEVNWNEIAEHYFKEEVSEEDQDIMQQIADSLASK